MASFLYPAQAQNALGMAQNLFFTSSPDAKINDVINKIQEKQKKIDELTKSFNTKFADKNEEELTDAEKAEMKKILADIDAVKAEIAKLQSSSSEMTAKWTKRDGGRQEEDRDESDRSRPYPVLDRGESMWRSPAPGRPPRRESPNCGTRSPITRRNTTSTTTPRSPTSNSTGS